MNTFRIMMAPTRAYLALIFSACGNQAPEAGLINTQASLPNSLKFEEMGLKVKSSFINKKAGTMSMLYASGPGSGETLVLVTWKQQDDARWFGAKVPGALNTIEIVAANSYRKYEGGKQVNVEDMARLAYILRQQPSVMP